MSSVAVNSPAVAGRFLSRPALATLLVFVVSFLAVALMMSPQVNAYSTYDEGIILTGAMRVAAGAVPHRDFYANYGPGQFYVLAGLFDLFGQTVLVERLYDVVVKAGIVCFVYLIATQLMRPPYAALATALGLVWIAAARSPVYPIWPCLLLIFASIWIVLPVFRHAWSARRLFCAGLSAGGIVLFRYDMGSLALVILSAALALFGLIEPQPFRSRARILAATLAPFCSGAGLIVAALVLVYVRYGIASDFIFQIVAYPALHYAEMRGLPFPTVSRGHLSSMIIYMPPLAVIGFLLLMITQFKEWRLSASGRREAWISSVVACFAAGFYFKGVVRVSIIQMMSSIVPSFLVLGFVLDRLMSRQRLFAGLPLALPAIAASVFALVPSVIVARDALGIARANLSDAIGIARGAVSKGDAAGGEQRCSRQDELPRARCFQVSVPEREAVRYVVAHSAPDQPIFVANGINDKVFIDDMAMYFLAGRQPATKWSQFDPGLQNSEPIQVEMIAELERNRPPLVILDSEWDDVSEPNGSARHSGVTLLDDYIHEKYRLAANFGPYAILQR